MCFFTFPLKGSFVGGKAYSLGVVAAAALLPVCQFQTLILYLLMELFHALCSLRRQKLWIGEMHRESQQSYCQGNFSCISLTKEFLTFFPLRYRGRRPLSHPVSA